MWLLHQLQHGIYIYIYRLRSEHRIQHGKSGLEVDIEVKLGYVRSGHRIQKWICGLEVDNSKSHVFGLEVATQFTILYVAWTWTSNSTWDVRLGSGYRIQNEVAGL